MPPLLPLLSLVKQRLLSIWKIHDGLALTVLWHSKQLRLLRVVRLHLSIVRERRDIVLGRTKLTTLSIILINEIRLREVCALMVHRLQLSVSHLPLARLAVKGTTEEILAWRRVWSVAETKSPTMRVCVRICLDPIFCIEPGVFDIIIVIQVRIHVFLDVYGYLWCHCCLLSWFAKDRLFNDGLEKAWRHQVVFFMFRLKRRIVVVIEACIVFACVRNLRLNAVTTLAMGATMGPV